MYILYKHTIVIIYQCIKWSQENHLHNRQRGVCPLHTPLLPHLRLPLPWRQQPWLHMYIATSPTITPPRLPFGTIPTPGRIMLAIRPFLGEAGASQATEHPVAVYMCAHNVMHVTIKSTTRLIRRIPIFHLLLKFRNQHQYNHAICTCSLHQTTYVVLHLGSLALGGPIDPPSHMSGACDYSQSDGAPNSHSSESVSSHI